MKITLLFKRRNVFLVLWVLQPCLAHAQGASAQTVVITATRHAMPLADAPASMSVITQEEIEARGADNVLDALRGEPSLSLQGRAISGRKTISLRGMDGRHTLYLVDGMRVGNTDGVVGHSDYQYDWVAPQEIDRIEIVRGPMSVLYGAEALGGVINVLTRVPGERWALGGLVETSAAPGGGGGDGHRLSASASGALGERWRLAVTANDSRRQSVASDADPSITAIEGRHKQEGSVRVFWLPAVGHRVELTQRSGDEERWLSSRETRGQKRLYESLTGLSRSHSSLGWQANWGGAMDVESRLRVYRSRIDADNTRTNGVAALRPNALDDRVLEGHASASPRSGLRVTSGFEWRDERLTNEAIPGGEGSADHKALYAQGEIEAAQSLAITAGLRVDRHDTFGTEWSPRIYAVWRPAADWVVKGGVGHGFKAPNLKQISPGYQEDEGPNTFFSNPDLKPEKNTALEIGLGWNTEHRGVQVTLFRNRVDDLIVSRLTGQADGRAQYTFENVDRARLQGLEVEAHAGVGGGFTTRLSYTYLDAEDGNGARLEKRPRHTLGANLDWRQAPWRAGLRVEHQRNQLLASAVPGASYQAVPPLTRASVYSVRELGHGLELSAGIDNLTNLKLANKSPLFTWTEMPRTWRVALRGRW